MIVLATMIAFATLFVLVCLLSTVIGAVIGTVVGFVFPSTMYMLLDWMGLSQAEPWQLGAMLGFVGSFFRANANMKDKS